MTIINEKITAVILAAGSGSRIGGKDKGRLLYQGKLFLDHAISLFLPFVDEIIVTIPKTKEESNGVNSGIPIQYVRGGDTRQASFFRALDLVSYDKVLVHDVARPQIKPALIKEVVDASLTHMAVTSAGKVGVRDSLSYSNGEFVGEKVNRESLISIQTPQIYHKDLLKSLYAQAKTNNWFEDSLVTLATRANFPVKIVVNKDENIKVTYPQDLLDIEPGNENDEL